jgi:hypothetical protein
VTITSPSSHDVRAAASHQRMAASSRGGAASGGVWVGTVSLQDPSPHPAVRPPRPVSPAHTSSASVVSGSCAACCIGVV